MNGRFVNTIYGRKFISIEQENKENGIIVIAGLIITICFLIFN